MVVRQRRLWVTALVGLAMLGSARAADRPDDIVAVVISDSFGGKPGLFLEAVRSSADAGGLGIVDLFCLQDGPGWALMRAKGKLIAINGSGKTSADRGMRAFMRNGASQVVVPDVPDIVLPDAIATIAVARAPCQGREARGVEQTLARLREGAARYAASGGRYRSAR